MSVDISPKEAKKLIGKVIVLDVRTQPEFDEGHLESAKNIDIMDPDFKKRLDSLDREQEYLVYCRTANRSSMAVRIMDSMGFSHVYHMLGGIVEYYY